MTRFRRHLAATAGALGVAAIVAGTATAATVTNIDTGDPQGQPLGIVAGPGGSMFFADAGANSLSQITPGGAVVPNGYVGAQAPAQVALGPDGNVWTTEGGTTLPAPASHVTRVTPGGSAAQFNVPASNLQGITAGPDGKLWFVSQDADALFSVTTSGRGRRGRSRRRRAARRRRPRAPAPRASPAARPATRTSTSPPRRASAPPTPARPPRTRSRWSPTR